MDIIMEIMDIVEIVEVAADQALDFTACLIAAMEFTCKTQDVAEVHIEVVTVLGGIE